MNVAGVNKLLLNLKLKLKIFNEQSTEAYRNISLRLKPNCGYQP